MAYLKMMITPVRRPRSIRRTSSLQSLWRSGMAGPVTVIGAARDLFTGDNQSVPRVLDQADAEITLTPAMRVESIQAARLQPTLSSFRGLNPGGELRKAMAAQIPQEVSGATLLHRLLDDLGGAAFMAPVAWKEWTAGGLAEYEASTRNPSRINRNVEGVCVSFQRGSSAVRKDGTPNLALATHPRGPLPFRADDPHAWHRFTPFDGPNQWRIRRVDLWRAGGALRAEVGFQDSAAIPDGARERIVFHEYGLQAVVEPQSWILREIQVTAGALPYPTCIAAPASAQRMVNQPLATFGRAVSATLPGILGCTHLNEMLRSLVDLVAMAAALEHELPAR